MQNFSFFYKDSLPLPAPNKAIWLHASSVGEVQALKPLITRLLQNTSYKIIISTMTITGQAQVKKMFGKKVFSIYKPYDLKCFNSWCLKKVQPDMLIVMETELWPNLIKQVHLQKISLYLINARLSDRSLTSYKKIFSLAKATINSFDYIFTQSQKETENFLSLGASKERLHNAGNIKYDITLPDNLNTISLSIKDRLFAPAIPTASSFAFKEKTALPSVWIAASTHHNEEEILLDIHQSLRQSQPQALLILAPRHPERFSAVINLCKQKNMHYITRSSKKPCNHNTEVFILDSLGELLYFYPLAQIAFIGGSLVPIGGHNPLEALAVNTPVVWGPHMFHFTEIKNTLLQNHLALEVSEKDQLKPIVLQALQNLQKKDFTDFFKAHSGAVDTIYNKITS
ncbi:MAG: 3-deoxy-D-manno-octulosonic acid transferase [Bdellovibrionaceae bacterium]|nr:3-deoxy-D-manno-octulosonic acid transferase [Pseudobdellovibrionaceae bacterium]